MSFPLSVDFGYILGRDPKPFPPPVKVCREMVDAMGGPNSPHYNRFKSLCYTAFIGLRKNANLILNLIALMVDANIQDIRLEPDKAVLKVRSARIVFANSQAESLTFCLFRYRRSSCSVCRKRTRSSTLKRY